jgi:hypothetical protein
LASSSYGSGGLAVSAPADNVEFCFVADGEPTDEAIAALAALLLDIVNHETAGIAPPPKNGDLPDITTDPQPKDKAS